jgi:phosphatidylglycerophosphate synthase
VESRRRYLTQLRQLQRSPDFFLRFYGHDRLHHGYRPPDARRPPFCWESSRDESGRRERKTVDAHAVPDRVDIRPGDALGTHDAGTKLDQLYRSVTVPIARYLARYAWVTPNRVSLSAFVAGGIITPVLILAQDLWMAGVAFILSDLLDYLDGDVARAQGTTSPEGDILDGVLDRYTDYFSLAALTIVTAGVLSDFEPLVAAGIGVPDARIALLIGLAALLGSMMPSYIQAVTIANGKRTIQSIGGRGTRNRLLFAGLLLGEPLWTLAIIAVVSNAATIHRTMFSVRRPDRR